MAKTPLRFVPKGAVKVADKASDAVAYLYDSQNPVYTKNGQRVPCAMLFFGKQTKPVWKYKFGTEQRRADVIAEGFKDRREALGRKAAEKAKAAAFVNPYKLGDIFRMVWGYDQTNVNYFEVTQVKGKFVIVTELQATAFETNAMTGKCAPLPGQFKKNGKVKKCLARDGFVKIESYANAYYIAPKMTGGVPVYGTDNFSTYA